MALSDIRISESIFKFEINYSATKDLPTGSFIRSPTFIAGGYDWALDYYPQGFDVVPERKVPHVSIGLILTSEAKDVSASYTIGVHDKKGKLIGRYEPPVKKFTSSKVVWDWGYVDFFNTVSMQKDCCVNDVLVISCKIRVTEPRDVQVSPGGLGKHIQKLWEKGEEFDVTFEVEGESISAHRLVVAARSPVFRAKLFGPMAEAKMERIKIDEMQAQVFEALLHFMYIDQLAINGSSDDQNVSVELLQDLFVAADLYALDELIELCEEQLVNNLSVDTVVTTLLLADQHSHARLKEKCLAFASDPMNFSQVALTEGYLHIMEESPLLLDELSSKVKESFFFVLFCKTSKGLVRDSMNAGRDS